MEFRGRASPQDRLVYLLFACAISACALINLLHRKLADFRVYWFGIGTFFRHVKPLYGMNGGLGYPMLFRYPPTFAVFFSPLATFSFRTAGAIWTILEWTCLLAITAWAFRRFAAGISWQNGLGALLLATPYVFLSFKDGNAQWLATLLILAALLCVEKRPSIAGFAFAAAVAIKVWPVLFLPLFLPRERRRSLAYVAVWSAVIWTLPAFVFGTHQYWILLHDWTAQEIANHVGAADIWYPSQSLRGLLLRYFTDPFLTLPYRSEFPDVHIAALPPTVVVSFATLSSATFFLYVAWGSWRACRHLRFCWDAMCFIAFSAFQPFCDRASLISIFPAILVAGASLSKDGTKRARVYWTVALVCGGLEILSSLSRTGVRWFEALGLHLPLMLALGLVLWQQTRGALASRAETINEPERALAAPQ